MHYHVIKNEVLTSYRVSFCHELLEFFFSKHRSEHVRNLLQLLHTDVSVLVSVKNLKRFSSNVGIRIKCIL